MRALIALLFLVAANACGAPANQDSSKPNALTIDNAWAAPTPAGVEVSAGYLRIINETSRNDRLLTATSPRAERVEIHEMTMDGAVMRMRAVQSLDIPAGEAVILAPGGMHFMFYGVTAPLADGEEIPIQLTFEAAGPIDLVLPVRRSAPQSHVAH